MSDATIMDVMEDQALAAWHVAETMTAAIDTLSGMADGHPCAGVAVSALRVAEMGMRRVSEALEAGARRLAAEAAPLAE